MKSTYCSGSKSYKLSETGQGREKHGDVTLELVLNMLAEATTTQFSKDRKPTTFQENLAVAKAGGQVAGRTRKDIESQSDTPVITSKNAAQLNQVVTDLLEGAVSDTTEESKDK